MAVIIKKMSVDQWINIPDNPRQRDTVRHAKSAKRTHLATLEDAHGVVFAAITNGEVTYKLDGHTRAYLWENGELDIPRGKLLVVCFNADTEAEAKRLYQMFDNEDAKEGVTDRVSGACREAGLALASPLLRGYRFTLAMQCASGSPKLPRREYEYVRIWESELKELDSWDLSRGIHTSLVALALVLIANGKKEKAMQFFTSFDNDEGIKDSRGNDGVQALTIHSIARKSKDQNTGWDNITDFFERAYTCFAYYDSGRRLKSGPRRTSRDTFAKAVKTLRKRTQDKIVPANK
jgi:hypothetical protein